MKKFTGKFTGKMHVNAPLPKTHTGNGHSQTTPDVVCDDNVLACEAPFDWNWEVTVGMLSILYTLVISSLGIVLPLSLFLVAGLTFKEHGTYLIVFQMYLYVSALAVIFYMWIINRRLTKAGQLETHTTIGSLALKPGETAPPLYEGIEEVNFFLRMGLVAFCMGGGLMEGFRMSSFAEEDSMRMWHCFGVWYLVLAILRTIFLITQTFILFKYHRVVLNHQHAIMKWCMAHLLATNLSSWAQTVILEAVESYHHAQALAAGAHKRAAAPKVPAEHQNNTGTVSLTCGVFPDTLATVAAPYLFPFMIEYALLAAAILYNISNRIGCEEYEEVKELLEERCEEKLQDRAKAEYKEPVESLFEGESCSKAHTGLFSGIWVVIMVGVAICFFLYIKTSAGAPTPSTGMIHIVSDLLLTITSGIATCVAFWKTHRLFFTAHLENMLDQNLLVIALFGYYILLAFIAIAALAQTGAPGYYGQGAKLIGAMAIIDVIQITLLSLFIVDGLRRRAITDQQARDKPGRSLVTFLLVCNLGLWLVNTFMLKETYAYKTFSGYYGDMAWIIILNLTLPLAIYYRFHVAVCLSEIWSNTYKKVSLNRIVTSDMAKCGKIL